MISIYTNLSSLRSQRQLLTNRHHAVHALEKLSSGLRINRASDDAAGLGISENLKAQIRSIAQATRNANDAISLLQVAESGLSEISGMLIRMRELAMQSANGTLADTERGYLHVEFTALIEEINRIAETTHFNGIQLLDGTALNLQFQVGFRDSANDVLSISLPDAHADALSAPGIEGLTVATEAGASGALSVLDLAMGDISSMRSDIGTFENRLRSTISHLRISEETLSAANSRIRDVDIAFETSQLTKHQILTQANIAVLSQAHQKPELALNLLN